VNITSHRKALQQGKEQKGDAVIYTYTLQNMPPKKAVEYAPGESYTYPHLLVLPQSARADDTAEVTYFQTVQDQYNWYHSLVSQMNNDASSFKATVQELVKNKITEKEKTEAVFQWCRRTYAI
jgi:hypothetical protein